MGVSFKDLGADILLAEQLLEPSLCNHVVQIAECYEFRSPPAGASLTGEQRSGEVLPLDNRDPLMESTNQLLLSQLQSIRDLLTKRYQVPFSHAELYSIDRYRPGQSYKRHADGLLLSNRYEELAKGLPARDVSIIGYLNQEFEGGELVFDRQNVKVKPAIGNAIVFPACYTHPYQTLPVLRGCKYTVTCWLLH
jgi:predicted 2-oxoglutarate/Fe(II)-dependent dioxygenase YbiX